MEHTGHLYIVATPIGNLQDITFRAVETLRSSDVIVCEDTRVTGKLLHHFEIKRPMRALNEFNEENIMYEILDLLKDGKSVSLVSDAGTPLISDPGYKLVKLAREKEVQVIPIPGASAAIAALSASGLPSDSFIFVGFLPKNKTKLTKIVTRASGSSASTLIAYESPHRIVATLSILQELMGDCEIVVAREVTKMHEEIVKKKISEFLTMYTNQQPKGEITLLFSVPSTILD
jgi:16S rRNA (cytidine1402-2'-O)-methyltransferase